MKSFLEILILEKIAGFWKKIYIDRVHNSEIQNNGSNMAGQNNKNKQIWIWNSVHGGFLSPLLKLEIQKFHKILIW